MNLCPNACKGRNAYKRFLGWIFHTSLNRVDHMSGRWVQDCRKIVDQIKKLDDIKGQDRLDMVGKIRFILYGLQRSVSGWIEWIDNPDIMANFSLEELKKISKNLAKLTQSFIEYDCEITSLVQGDLAIREPATRTESTKKPKGKTEIFYVK